MRGVLACACRLINSGEGVHERARARARVWARSGWVCVCAPGGGLLVPLDAAGNKGGFR